MASSKRNDIDGYAYHNQWLAKGYDTYTCKVTMIMERFEKWLTSRQMVSPVTDYASQSWYW